MVTWKTTNEKKEEMIQQVSGTLCDALNRKAKAALLGTGPDPGVERSADTEANTDAEAKDEYNDENLNNHAVPLAEAREAVAARVLPLAGLCLGLPMIPAGPNLAVLVATIPHKIC